MVRLNLQQNTVERDRAAVLAQVPGAGEIVGFRQARPVSASSFRAAAAAVQGPIAQGGRAPSRAFSRSCARARQSPARKSRSFGRTVALAPASNVPRTDIPSSKASLTTAPQPS